MPRRLAISPDKCWILSLPPGSASSHVHQPGLGCGSTGRDPLDDCPAAGKPQRLRQLLVHRRQADTEEAALHEIFQSRW